MKKASFTSPSLCKIVIFLYEFVDLASTFLMSMMRVMMYEPIKLVAIPSTSKKAIGPTGNTNFLESSICLMSDCVKSVLALKKIYMKMVNNTTPMIEVYIPITTPDK